jgi:hypothetical protein
MPLALLRPVSVGLALFSLCLDTFAAQETDRHYLSGHDKDDAVSWRFFCTTGALSGFWTNIPVPSNWEMKGFGHLAYSKDSAEALTERGLYETEFTAPAEWRDQRVFLVFEGAMTDTSAKLNATSVGPMHQGGFYRFKYEVSNLIRPGATNKLEVTVAKHSANESVNRAERQADYWVFGGIFRPVYLEVVPRQFIERVAIDARADGNFAMEVFLNGVTDADAVEAQILTSEGKTVGGVFSSKPLSPSEGEREADRPGEGRFAWPTKLHTQVVSPKLWKAETPNLYRVEVRLKRGSEVLHQFTERFGFRTFEVRDGDGLYLNGQKIILKGVNRHSFWPDSGRCLSEAIHRLDIETIKEMNGNAVRMSHYPPDAQFLDLCDELGLYVLDELAGWQKFYDTDIGNKLVEEMVPRDVNHPSILFWDNGNEGGFNTNLDQVFGRFDPQRRRVLHPWATFSGLNTAHYLSYDKAEAACGIAKTHSADGLELTVTHPVPNIYLPTEFMHGLYDGGAGAGLDDYWRMMMGSSNCAGGFIWALTDDGVKRPDTGQIDTAGNRAPDGIVGPYREREGSFYAIKEIWSPTPPDEGKLRQAAADAENSVAALRRSASSRPPRSQKAEWLPSAVDVAVASMGEVAVSINKQTGLLAGIRTGTTTISLVNGPRPVRGEVRLKTLLSGRERDGLTLTATYEGALRQTVWHLKDTGEIRCDYRLIANGTNDAIGVLFDYPEKLVQKKRWLGDGPYRVWKNRLRGVTLGVWENKYNNTITGWRDWIYPEFKGCFSNVRWLQLETTEGLITVMPENIPFVQVLTPEPPPANLVANTKVNLPECGLGFLHAIPPMGNKFKTADQGGPQGQPNVGQGEYSGSVSFFFGEVPR